jgi:hypothetical protein
MKDQVNGSCWTLGGECGAVSNVTKREVGLHRMLREKRHGVHTPSSKDTSELTSAKAAAGRRRHVEQQVEEAGQECAPRLQQKAMGAEPSRSCC